MRSDTLHFCQALVCLPALHYTATWQEGFECIFFWSWVNDEKYILQDVSLSRSNTCRAFPDTGWKVVDVQVKVRGQNAINACLCFPNSMARSVNRTRWIWSSM